MFSADGSKCPIRAGGTDTLWGGYGALCRRFDLWESIASRSRRCPSIPLRTSHVCDEISSARHFLRSRFRWRSSDPAAPIPRCPLIRAAHRPRPRTSGPIPRVGRRTRCRWRTRTWSCPPARRCSSTSRRPRSRASRSSGTLTFADTDLALSANYIQVKGGLQIGTEAHPYTKRASITLTGDESNESVLGLSSKALSVASGATLELHGAPRTVWTRLSATATKGTMQL